MKDADERAQMWLNTAELIFTESKSEKADLHVWWALILWATAHERFR